MIKKGERGGLGTHLARESIRKEGRRQHPARYSIDTLAGGRGGEKAGLDVKPHSALRHPLLTSIFLLQPNEEGEGLCQE